MTRPIILLAICVACTPAPKVDQPSATDTAQPASATAVTAPTGLSTAAAFRCADATQIFALFRTDSAGKAEVALAIGEERLHLPQVTSASGARYADSSITFWNKGDGAEFSRGGKQTTCQVEK